MIHVDDLRAQLARGLAVDNVKGPPREPLLVRGPTLLQMVRDSLPKPPPCTDPECPLCGGRDLRSEP